MAAKFKVGVLVVLVIASSAAFAASANTSAEIDRTSSVNVVSDDAGLLALDAGTSTGIVSQNTTGALAIDFQQNGSDGVNTASTFELGNPDDANNSSAFNITNQDSQSHDINLDYTGADQNSESNIEFQVYDSDGTEIDTADEEGTSAAVPLESGETAHVVVVVDTHGLTMDDDLTGTLKLVI